MILWLCYCAPLRGRHLTSRAALSLSPPITRTYPGAGPQTSAIFGSKVRERPTSRHLICYLSDSQLGRAGPKGALLGCTNIGGSLQPVRNVFPNYRYLF